MEYFFYGKYRDKVTAIEENLSLLKLGKIIGEDYQVITIGYSDNAKEAYDLFICGYLTRGSNAYVIKTNDKNKIRFITRNSNSEKGIFFEKENDEIVVSLFRKDGKYLEEEDNNKINYLLSSSISFPLSQRIGALYDHEELENEYNKYLENKEILEDD